MDGDDEGEEQAKDEGVLRHVNSVRLKRRVVELKTLKYKSK